MFARLWLTFTQHHFVVFIYLKKKYLQVGSNWMWCNEVCNISQECSHLWSGFSFKVESFVTIFHHKLVEKASRIMANGWTHPSSMTIFVYLFIRDVIREVTIVILNTIWRNISYSRRRLWEVKWVSNFSWGHITYYNLTACNRPWRDRTATKSLSLIYYLFIIIFIFIYKTEWEEVINII